MVNRSSYEPSQWPSPPTQLTLGHGEVHVWRANLEEAVPILDHLGKLLSAKERNRAQRFHRKRDAAFFLARRGVQRLILARYVGIAPSDLRFARGKHGKPELVTQRNEALVCFNASHSDGVALYAVACEREVGVDVERCHRKSETEQIASRYFTSRESQKLLAIPTEYRNEAFYACWTRKEAYMKAKGLGLRLGLDQFEVGFAPGEPAALLSSSEGPEEIERWSMKELYPSDGYLGAVCAAGADWTLKLWDVSPWLASFRWTSPA